MRLINIDTLRLEEFFSCEIPPYFILSHTWGEDEISFQEYLWLQNHAEEVNDGIIDELSPKQQERLNAKSQSLRGRRGYSKIWAFARLCRRLRDGDWGPDDGDAAPDDTAPWPGVDYIWVDTCCINKESSAELSEAINSMYKWYENAVLCIAHLSDVEDNEINHRSDFRESRWFTRGWTLQELLAPDVLFFYNKKWNFIAQRSTAADVIQTVTRIDHRFLTRTCPIEKVCLAERMSWAAERKTTRLEDEAYCLMGIFNVNMPLLYGEGRKAFHRLQQEIIRSCNDQSIFAWGLRRPITSQHSFDSMLAPSPSSFTHCTTLSRLQPRNLDLWSNVLDVPYHMTNVGLAITVNLFRLSFGTNGLTRTYAVLPTTIDVTYPLCLPLTSPDLEKMSLSDLPDGMVLSRPLCEPPIPLFRIPTQGSKPTIKLVRKSIIIDNASAKEIPPGVTPPTPWFWVSLDLSPELSFIETWSASLGKSHLVRSEPLRLAFSGSEKVHYRAWHPVFFLIRREVLHAAGLGTEYVVALSLDPESQTVQWMRVFDWEVVRRKKGIFAPSMAALFLAAPELADHAAWAADEVRRSGIRIQCQVGEPGQTGCVFRFGLEYDAAVESRKSSAGKVRGCGEKWGLARGGYSLGRSRTVC